MASPARWALCEVLGRAGGALLAVGFGLTARLRGTRALHPVGVCGEGLLRVTPGPPSGVVILDEPGPHICAVRWSRAMGRQRGRDIEGLALRVDGQGDLLLASTGTGVLGRHLLVPRRLREHGPLSTLLPLQTARGPLLLALDPIPADVAGTAAGELAADVRSGSPVGDEAGGRSEVVPPTAYRLLVSAPGHPWHQRGTLETTWSARDCPRRHDPVGHPPVGTWTHPFWAGLRDPSYAASQQVGARQVEPEPTTGDEEGGADTG